MSDWADWLGPCDWCNEAEDGSRLLCEDCEERQAKRDAYMDYLDKCDDEWREGV